MEFRQVELSSLDDGSRLLCWLERDDRIKVGARLTLRELPRREWTVTRVYRALLDGTALNRTWRVGGLR